MATLTIDLKKSFKFESIQIFQWFSVLLLMFFLCASSASAQNRNDPQSPSNTYSANELVNSGHKFFGSISKGLALAIESAISKYGRPNGYILGQEGSGAFVAGLRYGEGTLFTKRQGNRSVYWQGPSFGFDFGADGDRTMMLVYNLPGPSNLEGRFGGVDGSAYFIAGFGITALTRDNITLVPIRSGVGARLGFNVGYLKFSNKSTWNPF